MAEQRSGFRIRVPRLRPLVQPPRPAPADTQTPARKPPFRPRPNPLPTQPPIPPQGTAPAPPPAPPLAAVPSPSPSPSPAAAGTPPPLPIRPLGKTPEPPSVPPLPAVPSPSPTPARASLAQEAPAPAPAPAPTPPIQHLGTVPAQPPLPPPPPPPQDQQASMAATPPSSSSQPGNQSRVSSHPSLPSHMSTQPPVSAKLPSPSTRSQPTSQPSENTPEVKRSTEIPSNNVQKGTDYALNATVGGERHEQTSMEVSSEHSNSESHIKELPRIKNQKTKENQHKNQEAISPTNNIPKTTQSNSMISHPDDKNPESKSPENPKPNGTNPDLNEKPANVITFAGDNRGTSMHIGSDATKREKSIHIYRRYKVNPDETTDTTTDGEEDESDLEGNENHEKNAYINCNIQGINNSMVFNCSFTERNPGVHLGSCNPENVKKPKRRYVMSTDLNKVKVNITPSQKHTIRRRCLRGLFMESSDSDPNDPQKPTRHGCR